MATATGTTRRAPADPLTEAYERGLDGRPLSSSLKRKAERDPAVLDTWRDGMADRNFSRKDADPDTGEENAPQVAPGAPQPAPPAPRAPAPRRSTSPRSSRRSSGSSSRRPGFPGIGGRVSSPSLTRPTGGRSPRDLAEGAGGLLLGGIFYALILSVVEYGATGPSKWFKAKFLDQAATAPTTPSGQSAGAPPNVGSGTGAGAGHSA